MMSEDLYDALIISERTILRPPGRLIPVDELLRDLGYDSAEFGFVDGERSGSGTL